MLEVQPYDARYIGGIAELNRRLAAGDARYEFPERPELSWPADAEGSPLFQEFFLALDGETVRGGYALQHRTACFRSEERTIGSWYPPITEGQVDPEQAPVARELLRDALRREPLCFGLGLEGLGSPLSKLAATLGCELRLIPFFVRIENGRRFARDARYLRKRRALAPLLDVAAATGVATLGAGLLRRVLQRGRGLAAGATVEQVTEFGPWADELWLRCRGRYSFVEVRDAARLRRLYPDRQRHRALRVVRGNTTLGWAVLDAKRMSDDKKFGDLHVGRIADCFAAPEDADDVLRAAVDALASEGVDVMLSNQSHPAWCAALRRNAFLSAPSNFVFAMSPELGKKIREIDPDGRDVHLNRGDKNGAPLVRAPFSARRARRTKAARAGG